MGECVQSGRLWCRSWIASASLNTLNINHDNDH